EERWIVREIAKELCESAADNLFPITGTGMTVRAKRLMFLGTGSDVGKSVLAAAFCRILKQDGYSVAPFKAQNMALNSFITPEGGEMGRAQVVQAEAAGIAPHVDMNPILLKPTSQMGSQLIVHGKAVANFSASEYYQYKKNLIPVVKESFERLAQHYDVVVLEGAGSAVELNLKEHDLVNLAMAEMADAPCILVGDIDRGGIFAALLGSFMLMTPGERERIIGLVVNKFRGDPQLFTRGVEMMESHAGRPVFGVIPYFDHIALPEEDSVALGRRMQRDRQAASDDRLAIGVVRLPFVSNYTDFDCFEQEPGVDLEYFNRPERAFQFDAVILPGSKNTIEDLDYLQRTGMAEAVVACYKSGGTVVGLCGGYQMLGLRVSDPHGVESRLQDVAGLGLLDMDTEMFPEKITSQIEAAFLGHSGFSFRHSEALTGYEIHMGRSRSRGVAQPLFRLIRRGVRRVDEPEGLSQPDGRVWGTYIHGIFDNDDFRSHFLKDLRQRSGKADAPPAALFSYGRWKEEQFDRLAAHVRRHCDVGRIYRRIGLC
ncbi:MAG TPA: cobyric acid synthase, partial [Syntrophobacteraceae bacterium]|nr:cobyric acid synthase [Syntrophobacteraceae bacterium]